ncbi:hypothetical protein ASF54_08205 [Frondihabitans sp. Leaf304]|nr:hypothetical protein ASF54_08205 [Frondihabitans sp. Leaf304]
MNPRFHSVLEPNKTLRVTTDIGARKAPQVVWNEGMTDADDAVRVENPSAFWFATAADVTWFADPNDGRYPQHTTDWSVTASWLERAVDSLARGAWEQDGDDSWLIVSDYPGNLDRDGRFIIESLLWAHPIEMDPWDNELDDGRHRSWGLWNYDPNILIPIRSRLLQDSTIDFDPEFTPKNLMHELRDDHIADAKSAPGRIPDAVANRSARYLEQLRRLADS